MKNYLKVLSVILVMATFVGSCRDSVILPEDELEDPSITVIEDLFGVEWKLAGFQRQVGNRIYLEKIPDNQQFTLTFSEGNAGGMADCKGYSYKYLHDARRKISFVEPAPQPAVMCPPESYDALFYSAMQHAISYKATQATLHIYYGSDNLERALYFTRVNQNPSTNAHPILLYQLETIETSESDPYKLLNASISGDELNVQVQYSGGCESHEFTLMGPLVIHPGIIDFGDGNSTQPITIQLHHDANDDACEALITKELRFDLTPLKERWKELTGKTNGTIELSINDLHTGEVARLYYRTGNGSGTPDWLADTIAAISSRPVTDPPESIYQYTYNSQVVYYRPPICCDIFSDLYDQKGNIICHPDGGFTGMGDGQCSDFISSRTDEKLIWKDPR